MTTYRIENESNQIIPYTSEQDAKVIAGAERFRSEEDLANLAASWPMARLIEMWSNVPGVRPVKEVPGSQDGYYPNLEGIESCSGVCSGFRSRGAA